jgi:hypothetical protein
MSLVASRITQGRPGACPVMVAREGYLVVGQAGAGRPDADQLNSDNVYAHILEQPGGEAVPLAAARGLVE